MVVDLLVMVICRVRSGSHQRHNVEKKLKSFMTLGKGQFEFKVNIEGEKHIYIIPAIHSYHYLSSIVMVL